MGNWGPDPSPPLPVKVRGKAQIPNLQALPEIRAAAMAEKREANLQDGTCVEQRKGSLGDPGVIMRSPYLLYLFAGEHLANNMLSMPAEPCFCRPKAVLFLFFSR